MNTDPKLGEHVPEERTFIAGEETDKSSIKHIIPSEEGKKTPPKADDDSRQKQYNVEDRPKTSSSDKSSPSFPAISTIKDVTLDKITDLQVSMTGMEARMMELNTSVTKLEHTVARIGDEITTSFKTLTRLAILVVVGAGIVGSYRFFKKV